MDLNQTMRCEYGCQIRKTLLRKKVLYIKLLCIFCKAIFCQFCTDSADFADRRRPKDGVIYNMTVINNMNMYIY